MKKTIKNKLREYRIKSGYSLADVARLLSPVRKTATVKASKSSTAK